MKVNKKIIKTEEQLQRDKLNDYEEKFIVRDINRDCVA